MHRTTIEHFDVAISNPPYQLDRGDRNVQTIYHHFLEHAQRLAHTVSMIYPARWITGGRGENLPTFRSRELNSRHYRFFNLDPVRKFFNVRMDGDICTFVWDRAYHGSTAYSYHGVQESRDTLLDNSPVFIQHPRDRAIVSKVATQHHVQSYGRDYYGKYVASYLHIKELHARLQEESTLETVRVWYFDSERAIRTLPVPHNATDKDTSSYKVFLAATAHPRGSSLRRVNRIFIGYPNEVISTSFIQLGKYATLTEAEHMVRYLKTDFATFLFGAISLTKTVRQQDFHCIPAINPSTGQVLDLPEAFLDFGTDSDGLDEQLAAIYGLTPAEREHMRSRLHPWKDKNSLTADGKY